MQEDLLASNKQRRTTEAKRDKIAKELNNTASKSALTIVAAHKFKKDPGKRVRHHIQKKKCWSEPREN